MAIFLVLLLLGAVTAELKLSTAAEGGTIHESLAAGAEYTSRFVLATNTEPYTLPIKIMVEPAVAWMEVSAKMKNLKPSGTDAFSITLKPTGVAVGAYLTQVRIYPLITAAQGAIDLKSVYKIDVIMDIVAAAANAAGEGSFFFGEGFVRGSTFGVTTVVLGSVAVLVTLWLRAVRAKQRGGGSESEGVCCALSLPRLQEQLGMARRLRRAVAGAAAAAAADHNSRSSSAGDGGDVEMASVPPLRDEAERQSMLPHRSTSSEEEVRQQHQHQQQHQQQREAGSAAARRLRAGSRVRAPPLVLATEATMDPDDFESRWQSLAPRRMWGTAISRATEEELEPLMEEAGIFCLASGALDGVEKFFFYAESASDPIGEKFFAEVSIPSESERSIADRTLSVVFKATTERAAAIAQFVTLFRGALARGGAGREREEKD